MIRPSLALCFGFLIVSAAIAEDHTNPNNPLFQRRAAGLRTRIANEGVEAIIFIGGSYYGDHALAVAEQLPNLERANCACHGYVTDAGLNSLRGKQKLKQLSVSGPFTDAGLKVLATLPQLEEVRLRSAKLTDASAQLLGTIKTLKQISIYQSKISDEAVEELKRALPDCKIYSY